MNSVIVLTKGFQTIVDEDDYNSLSQYTWHAHTRGGNKKDVRAARRRKCSECSGPRCIFMHQQILGFPDSHIDHINRNPLDNRKENLRLCVQAQNINNKAPFARSGYKGVYRVPIQMASRKGYRAAIFHQGKGTHLGSFNTAEEAARAYDIVAFEKFGEFAYLNFPEEINKKGEAEPCVNVAIQQRTFLFIQE